MLRFFSNFYKTNIKIDKKEFEGLNKENVEFI